jgi:hypothetical protein
MDQPPIKLIRPCLRDRLEKEDLILIGTREFPKPNSCDPGVEKQEFNQYEIMIEVARKKNAGWNLNLKTVMDNKTCKYYIEIISREPIVKKTTEIQWKD